jgi:hypothetical protein
MKLSGSVPPWFFFIPKWDVFVLLSMILFWIIIFHILCWIFIPIWYEKKSGTNSPKKKRFNSKALSPQGSATAGNGNGVSQSRRAGSRGAHINCGCPGRIHCPCSCSTHRACKHVQTLWPARCRALQTWQVWNCCIRVWKKLNFFRVWKTNFTRYENVV